MATDRFASFSSQLARLERTRTRAEAAFAKRRIIRADVETVYESLFLRAITFFEAFLEELFREIMLGKIAYSRGRVVRLVDFKSDRHLNRVLLAQGRTQGNYSTWLPFNDTKRRAELWLRKGRPFSELDEGQLSKLQGLHTIRNAIAHSSDYARRRFLQDVVGGQNLSPRERTPAGYLRSVYILNPRTTRFEDAMEELRTIARRLLPNSRPRV